MKTTEVLNGVEMVEADVRIDEGQCREAYLQRCRTRMLRAQTGSTMQDIPFEVIVDGKKSEAYIMCEADDEMLDGTTIVARYVSSIDDRGEWYSLIIIHHYHDSFSPSRKVRVRESLVTMGLHVDARQLLNTKD